MSSFTLQDALFSFRSLDSELYYDRKDDSSVWLVKEMKQNETDKSNIQTWVSDPWARNSQKSFSLMYPSFRKKQFKALRRVRSHKPLTILISKYK